MTTEGISTLPAPVGGDPTPVTIVEEKTPSLDEELSDLYDKINPPKEAATKSVAETPTDKEVEPDKAAPSDDEKTKPNSDQPEKAASEPDKSSSPAIDPPQSWSAAVKAKWASLSPDVQSFIAAREKDAAAKISQQGNELKSFAPVRELYDAIRQMGVSAGHEPEIIANWARAQQILDHNPVEGLKWLANSYKVDLAQLVGNKSGKAEGEAIDDLFRDPRFDRIAPEVGELRNQIANLQRQLIARDNADQSVRQRQVEEIIETFSKGKEDWADLEPDIVNEIAVMKRAEPDLPYEKLLEKAYDRARWANPDIRARIREEEQKKERETVAAEKRKEAEEAAKKADKAKKVASMNVRTGATASTPAFDGKWDDSNKLSDLYDRITAGR